MPKTQTIYQLVCCGPSDVTKEIDLVKQVVDQWNLSIGLDADRFVRFAHWKTDATPDLSGRPQAVINRQIIDKGDILVAIFWGRFGTPTGKAKSGTQEEVLRAIKQKKRVLLYFSDLESPLQVADENQYKKVQQFRRDISDKGVYWTFKSRREFEQLFSIHLGRTLEELKSAVKAPRKPTKKSENTLSQRGLINVHAPGNGHNRPVTINIHHPAPKPAPKSKYAANSIGADANLVNYIDYLFGLAIEYWSGVDGMNAGRLGKKIKAKFKLKIRTRNHLSKERFDELVVFIIDELLKPSPAGKRHLRQGTRLCRTFEEHRSGPM
ncbi:MAG: hypothetical protein NTV80_12060 [Verrucomicrobia bacterium]|nr:hypothetical protein [Verrucomicrobiota bacterium]